MTTRTPGFVRLAVTALVIGCVSLAAGCQGYREANTRTVGEVIDDAAIQSRLKVALLSDPEIKGLLINTEVRQGVVTLHGRVSTRQQQQRAVALAAGIKGVVEVDDRLSIVTE